jgi:hypothetical protein
MRRRLVGGYCSSFPSELSTRFSGSARFVSAGTSTRNVPSRATSYRSMPGPGSLAIRNSVRVRPLMNAVPPVITSARPPYSEKVESATGIGSRPPASGLTRTSVLDAARSRSSTSDPRRRYVRTPRHRTLPTGRNTFRPQDACDRRAAHTVPKVLQRALNAGVTPRRILHRHPNDQRTQLRLQTHGTAAAAGPLPSDQLAMPT